MCSSSLLILKDHLPPKELWPAVMIGLHAISSLIPPWTLDWEAQCRNDVLSADQLRALTLLSAPLLQPLAMMTSAHRVFAEVFDEAFRCARDDSAFGADFEQVLTVRGAAQALVCGCRAKLGFPMEDATYTPVWAASPKGEQTCADELTLAWALAQASLDAEVVGFRVDAASLAVERTDSLKLAKDRRKFFGGVSV